MGGGGRGSGSISAIMVCLVYCVDFGRGSRILVCCAWFIIWMRERGSVDRLCLVYHTDGRGGSRSASMLCLVYCVDFGGGSRVLVCCALFIIQTDPKHTRD